MLRRHCVRRGAALCPLVPEVDAWGVCACAWVGGWGVSVCVCVCVCVCVVGGQRTGYGVLQVYYAHGTAYSTAFTSVLRVLSDWALVVLLVPLCYVC